MSRYLTIARNDFRHAIQDRLVWGAVFLIGVMFLPSVVTGVSGPETSVWQQVTSLMVDLMTFSMVLFAAIGYNSITGERAEGIVRLVLSLSGTRRDVVIGKFISRFSIAILAFVLILGIACVQTVRVFGMRSFIPFCVMAAWMLVYGIIWSAITIGYSAAFSTQYRTLGALVVTYAVFSPSLSFWGTVVDPLIAFAFTGSFSIPYFKSLAQAPPWIHLMARLNPLSGFAGMVTWSLDMLTGKTPQVELVYDLLGFSLFVGLGVVILFAGVRRVEAVDLDDNQTGPSWSTALLPTFQATSIDSDYGLSFVPLSEKSRVGTVTRGDLNRALKNWVVQGVFLLFILIVAPEIWQTLSMKAKFLHHGRLSTGLSYTCYLPVLVLATAAGYQAVVGERESHTIRYALGLPSTRRELVTGKLIARTGIVLAAIVTVLVLAELILLLHFGHPYLLNLLVATIWILLLGITWTSFAIGVSAAVSSRYRSLAVILGVYLLFSPDNGIWGSVIRPLIGLAFTGQYRTPNGAYSSNTMGPVWFRYLDSLNPLTALQRILQALQTVTGLESTNITPSLVLFCVMIVLLFAGSSLYVGYRRFDQTDLS